MSQLLQDRATFGQAPSLRLSIVVPVHNCEACLRTTVESLVKQTLAPTEYEIILVDDGSTDGSGSIADSLAEAHSHIVVIHQENRGVSAARNAGMDQARGRFIAFVDADDVLEPATLKGALDFFDDHFDEIDLVTYPMKIVEGKKTKPHVREKVLTHTGVFDLRDPKNAFALVTNVNVVVKNDGSLPRFDTSLEVHEDLQFMLTVLLRKQKVGFSKQGAYVYQKRGESATNTKMHPFYQLENCLRFWEALFAPYAKGANGAEGRAPVYLQGSFMNELNWKIKKGLLVPPSTHPAYGRALHRYAVLLGCVEDDVILASPRASELQRHYFLQLKVGEPLACEFADGGFSVSRGGTVLLRKDDVDAYIFRVWFEGGTCHLRGVLQSVAFEYADRPAARLSLQRKCESDVRDIPLAPATCDWAFSHERTNATWAFELALPCQEWETAQLFVEMEGHVYPAHWHFAKFLQANADTGVSSLAHGTTVIEATSQGDAIRFHQEPSLALRCALRLRENKAILKKNALGLLLHEGAADARPFVKRRPFWLYGDGAASGPDNAFYQFMHDIEKDDGIDRYYVAHEAQKPFAFPFTLERRERILDFGSPKHLLLFPFADKILTSRIAPDQWSPLRQGALNFLPPTGARELVYLQHGVHLAHAPWKYGAEKTGVDRIVVSTPYEERLFATVYGYAVDQIIPCGAPRYDFIESEHRPENRILFAPSWRKYLVTEVSGKAPQRNGKFETSKFWLETSAWLSDPGLVAYLNARDFHLDIQLQPNFACYEALFKEFETERIHVLDSSAVDPKVVNTHLLCITDYSPIAFDSVYARCPILYFFPDEEEFAAGLNGYSELDLPLEQGFGPVARTASELLYALANFDSQAGFGEPYQSRAEGFFLHDDNSQRERLYQALR
ncbi:bifunctional glycosyltransferase/CDP-glycerol:glycerophosphate glycerophosphotransferase [Xiamenia xianingshaonis]|nr:glycosyltransferase [Xiamenia xianingshaonis]QTU84177.1 glycosyltransferase [Xiamenia xianingshaonis]